MRALAGRHALVTGASGGLGRQIARQLAREGVDVAISGRNASILTDLAGELRHLGSAVEPVLADLAEPAQVESLVARAEDAIGPLDIVVNNAGIEIASSFTLYSDEEVERILALDLMAPLWLIRRVLPGMLERGVGHVVNIGSLASKGGLPFGVPYAAAKWGLAGMTQSLRAEYAGSGVGFSVVIPGFVTGEGIFARHEADGIRAPRLFGTTTPEEVALAVVRAIRRDSPEILVTPRPLRPFLALAALAPRTAERLAARFGVTPVARSVAGLHGRQENEADRERSAEFSR